MAIILETKATKDEILELYLNDVYLGNRGSFAMHGVAGGRAHLLRQGRQQPHAVRSGADRRRRFRIRISTRRSAIASAPRSGATSCCARWPRPTTSPRDAAERASQRSDHRGHARRRQRGAVLRRLPGRGAAEPSFPGVTQRAGALDIYTTLDLNLQRYAQDAVRDGLARVDETLSRGGASARARRRRRWSPSIRAPARFSRWSAAASTTSRSSIAPSPRAGSRARPSSRSSISPRSSARPKRAAPISRPPRWCGTSRRPGTSTSRSGRRATTTTSTTATSRCGARSRCRATSPPSRWPSRPASIASSRSGRRAHVGKTVLQGYPVDRARRLRADAARGRDGVHALRQRRRRSGRCAASRASRSGEDSLVPQETEGPTRRARRRRRFW